MIPVHSIIMWAQPRNLSIEESTDICYEILKLLKDYGVDLSPNFLPSENIKCTKEFELSRDNIKSLLFKNMNRENGKTFINLGSLISFFSSKIEEKSAKISICIGTTDKNFHDVHDVVTVRLPYSDFSGFSYKKEEFENLFYDLVRAFDPYYAFIRNSLNTQFSDVYWQNGIPTYVHWFNYYSNPIIDKIGRDRVEKIHSIKIVENGCFFKIQDVPIDVTNKLHLSNQYHISKFLGLISLSSTTLKA